jgi:hypothetical protein
MLACAGIIGRGPGNPWRSKPDWRPLIVKGFLSRLRKEGFQTLAIACASAHLHALVEAPIDLRTVKAIAGRCKRQACERIKHLRTGHLWSAGGKFKRVKDRAHQLNVYDYITNRQEPGAFVWTFKGETYWMARGRKKIKFTPRSEP